MRKKGKILFALGLFFGFGAFLGAITDDIGEIAYLEGNVQIYRNSKILASKDVNFGTSIQNYDQIKVGKNGLVEITIDPKTGVASTLVIKSNSTVTLDITGMKSSQAAGIDLLAGSLELKVQKLGAGNQLNVRTGISQMGVRGTKFEVAFAVNGDVLLSTSEGRVECTTSEGKVLFSAPGIVVLGSSEGDFSSASVAASALKDFQAKWHAEKIAALKADPGRATTQFGLRYLDLKDRFDAAYAELFAERDIILKWIREDNAGNIGSTVDRNREKIKLIGSLKKLRVVLGQFERIYYRVQELEELYLQGVAARGQVRQGLSVADFFRKVRNERDELSKKLADINFVTKLYMKRNDGTFPLDGGDLNSTDSGFVDTKSFF